MKRRAIVSSLVGMLFVRVGHALLPPAPPPPSLEELVRDAKIVVLGQPRSYSFKGLIPNAEQDQVFDLPGAGRGFFATVHQSEVLKNETEATLSSHMLVAGIPWGEYQELSDKVSVLLIRRAYQVAQDPSWKFDLLVKPVSIDLLPQVRQFISDQSKSKN